MRRSVVISALMASAVFAAPPSLRRSEPEVRAPEIRANPTGQVLVVVRLGDAPLAALNEGARGGSRAFMGAAAQRSHAARIESAQRSLQTLMSSTGARQVARLHKAINAVIVSVDASKVPQLAALPGVVSARPVGDYELHLADTVPYIGATIARTKGVTGRGVRVAVIDSGIDYTHRAFGGAGTAAAYEAAWGTSPADARNTTTDGLFPTAKVVGGWDFVGEAWPEGDVAQDPDPIDLEGHGSHVADIIAGAQGVAPDASLIAIKACSAVASSCNGVALLQSVEYALDPNGDDDLSDAVDVINMSLGSSYGQEQDDLTEASNTAAKMGVVVVASAGNSADRPYITGSPASAPEVISVAQTQVPTAKRFPLNIVSPATIAGTSANTEVLDWAPLAAGFSGEIAFIGRGCATDTSLTSPAGKVALIDRGACSVSEKVKKASDEGAVGIIIGLIADGDAVSFSNGGQCPVPADGSCKPAIVITQPVSARIKANSPVTVSVSPSTFVSLERSMVGSSARGPAYSSDAIKPDIGAPGASISAIAGTGTGTEAFGGTSGAAPMVSGAAALLVQAFPQRTPRQIKAMLMNSAEREVYTNPATLPGELAPITRIGAGEVRVDRALEVTLLAEAAQGGASLSFGALAPWHFEMREQRIVLTNLTSQPRFVRVEASFRYANDAASQAVSLDVPPSVRIPAGGTRTITARLFIDPAKLPLWNLNGGELGGSGELLQGVEFDGFVTFTDQTRPTQSVSMPWHVLPHRSSKIEISGDVQLDSAGIGSASLTNQGTVDGQVEVFALTGVSARLPRQDQPKPGDNFAIIDLRSVGVRLDGDTVQFGIATTGTRSHPNYPARFTVNIDANRDGINEVSVYNGEVGAFGTTGQNAVYVQPLSPDGGAAPDAGATSVFFSDADLNSGNVILTAPLAALGLTPTTQFNFSIEASDNYFTGKVTDQINGMTHTLATPKFVAVGLPKDGVPARSSSNFTVQAVTGGETASPSQTGLLLLYRDSPPRQESERIRVFR